MSEYHLPVLLNETISLLCHREGEIFVDATMGGGGHSGKIAEKIGEKGKLIAIDQDLEAIEEGKRRLSKFGNRVVIVYDNFINIVEVLNSQNIEKVDGILVDLGVSSHQIDTPNRGFSYNLKNLNSPLDMRMNQEQQLKAFDVVNFYPEKNLRDIFYKFGEESYGAQVAREIIRERDKKKIETTGELVEIIKKAMPPKFRFSKGSNTQFASNIFRSIRMEVNQELPVIESFLPQAFSVLKDGGRLAVITFHSLEDRIVKHQFQEWKDAGLVEVTTPKPILPSEEELQNNSRAASAKLRAIKKI